MEEAVRLFEDNAFGVSSRFDVHAEPSYRLLPQGIHRLP